MDAFQTMQETNRRSYGKIASLWNENASSKYDFAIHKRCREQFIKHLPGKRILEVGCGLGWDSHFFASDGYDITATDFLGEFVALAGSRNPKVKALVMDMLSPVSFSEPFQGIYGFASFLHIPREKSSEVLRWMGSILVSGGVLFLHHVQSNKGLSGYIQDNLLIHDNPVHCTCHSIDEMGRLLAEAGFSSLRFTRYSSRTRTALAEAYGLSSYQVLAIK